MTHMPQQTHLLLAGLAHALLLPPMIVPAAEPATVLRNDFVTAELDGPALVNVRADLTGHGRYGEVLWTRIDGPAIHVTGPVEITVADGVARAVGRAEIRLTSVTSINKANQVAVELPAGGHLGFTYEVPEGQQLAYTTLLVPTFHTRDSDVTLECRRDSPAGELLGHRRCIDLVDNAWQEIRPDEPASGRLWIGMREPAGKVGWWAATMPPPPGVTTLLNGETRPDLVLVADVHLTRRVMDAEVEWRLQGPSLTAIVRSLTPPESPIADNFHWTARAPWINTGHELSAKTAAYEAYHTAIGQFITAHQLKRRQTLGLPIVGSERITARGLRGCDTVIEGQAVSMSLSATDHEARHGLTVHAAPPKAGETLATLKFSFVETPATLPDMFPVFTCGDARAGELSTRFLWDRDLSYPPAPGASAWYEWNGLCRNWLNMPRLRDAERSVLTTVPITREGYVHTWGNLIGWPFPDGSKYDTRHFDSNSRFIMGVYRWVTWRRDTQFLGEQIARLRQAMDYQLKELQGASGVIVSNSRNNSGRHGSLGGNYWDILPFGHKDAYCNVMFYASLKAMAELEALAATVVPAEKRANGTARSPAEYLQLADKARKAFNETFWDDTSGRYIGCIDIDGVKHDYGFTFLNVEAMAYGLASKEQARRIYHWMEQEPTSTGKPDTYSAFLFAPRATTLHNPIKTDPADIEKAGRPPWWHMDWGGTPFGDQCQDGGAILYTSYYDLMARATLISPDNAWQRYQEILSRYDMPDRLCGGPPLVRGEIPQQENPGAVGVDLPFPESGLVPASMLYVFMGVMPEVDGLRITPRLPAGVDFIACSSVAYGPATLTIRVEHDKVRLTGMAGERSIELTHACAPGESVLIAADELAP